MKGDAFASKLREVDPQSFAEDLEWFLSGVESPRSLSDLDPVSNFKTKHFFDGQSGSNYAEDARAEPADTALDETVLSANLLNHLDRIVKRVSDTRENCQDDMMVTFLDHEEDIWEFATDLNYCDSTLRLVEEALLKHYKKLEVASTSITNLYSESEELSMSLENRKAFVTALKSFLDEVNISPKTIRAICREPIRFNYVQLLEQFKHKSEIINVKYSKNEYPALNPCRIQMKKLELVIVRRIYDFMTTEIAKLTTPKANLQMIQNTYFLHLQPLYAFILEANPTYAADIKTQYSKTMRKVYHHLFSNYYQALEKYRVKNRYRELSVVMKYSSSQPKGYFQLKDTEELVLKFKDDPLILTGLHADTIRNDHIVRSFLKLFVDTASSESMFVNRFFVQDAGSIFTYIFEETVSFLRMKLSSLMKSSYNVVMMGAIALLLGANVSVLKDRGITLLNDSLTRMQVDAYQCLVAHTTLLLECVKNHSKQATSSTIESWLPGAYAVNLSNMAVSLRKIQRLQTELPVKPFPFQVIDDIITTVNSVINLQGKKLNNPVKADILIIANCAAFMFPLEGLDMNLETLRITLMQHVKSYVNGYMHHHFDEMLDLVTGIKRSEELNPAIYPINNTSFDEGDAAKVSVSSDTIVMWRRIAEDFSGKLNEKFNTIKSKLKLHFTHEATVKFVQHKVLEGMEDIYGSFYGHLCKMVKQDDKVWMSKLPAPGKLNEVLHIEKQ